MFKRQRISVWEEEKCLEVDHGDGCITTMLIYLIPQNCTLKVIEMVSFVVCTIYQNKNNNSN